MKGKYEFFIHNNKIRFELTLERKVTLITGLSASGKTTLCRMCADVGSAGGDKSIHSNYKDKIFVLRDTIGGVWETVVKSMSGKFIFVDESFSELNTVAFGEVVNSSDNYFIICSRLPFGFLTYSLDSVYVLEADRQSAHSEHITKLAPRYGVSSTAISPDLIITEDSCSGYDMMKLINICDVVSADGNSSLYSTAIENLATHNKVLVIADREGIGSQVRRLVCLDKEFGDRVSLALPRSFEYLILTQEDMARGIEDKLTHTYDYCDAAEFNSWEQYYTDLLSRQCPVVERCSYSKTRLPKPLGQVKYQEHVLNSLPELVIPSKALASKANKI